jgi:hypothetical protein
MKSHWRGWLLVSGLILLISALACRFTYSIDFGNPNLLPKPNTANDVIFDVMASTQWNNSGVTVKPGDTLEIKYLSGSWSPWPGGNYDALGSGGDPRCTCNVIMGVSHAALIGKIGDNQPFLVGEEFRHTIGEEGVVFLGINDNRLSDNSGSLTVRIKVIRK